MEIDMYSRSVKTNFQNENGFRVPNNYRGNAFSFDRPKYEPPVIRESDIIHEPKNEVQEERCEAEEEKTSDVCEVCNDTKKDSSLLFGFSAEDLLLLALILILAENGADDDIILMLALILAYKK